MNDNNDKIGLSLVEVLIAVGLLAALMTPVILTFSSGARGIQMTSEEFVAHNAALELIEQLAATPFALIPTGKFADSQLKDGLPMGPSNPLSFRISQVPGIERFLEIKEIRSGSQVRFKKIEVRITLLDRFGKPNGRTIELKTLVANET